MRVGLSEMPSNIQNEVPVYPWHRFISDVGGSAGVILGISLLTIFMIIEGNAFTIDFVNMKISFFI